MKSLFFAKNKIRRNLGFFIMSIIEKYADYRFVQNAQSRAHRATAQIKVVARKPRLFCNASGAKSKIKKWRKSAKKFFHFCEKSCCKKTLVFLS